MDKLKDFIDNHKEAFEEESLPTGHFERFEQKLDGFRLTQPEESEHLPELPTDATGQATTEHQIDETQPLHHSLPRKNLRLYGLWGSFAAVAVVALLFLLRIPGGTPLPSPAPSPETPTASTCQTREEIEELRLYYTMQINETIAQIKTLYKNDKSPGAAELMAATKKVLTDNYMFEETVLPTLPCSNDALFAVTQHYTNSLESLSIMLKQMERVTGDE